MMRKARGVELNARKQRSLGVGAKDSANSELELQRLRAQVEEREKEIAALRQAAKVKDRKVEQLNYRCRKEQLRQYYRFMELEPVVELEEDAEDPPSLSPPPCAADIWAEDSLYSSLLREHLDLQRAHNALENRLKKSEARARQLNELRRTSGEQLQQLQAEALELRELNELLEFRILELEEEPVVRSPGPGRDTRDVCTDTDNDDISDLSLPSSEEDLGVHDLKLVKSAKNAADSTATVQEVTKPATRIVATVLPFTEVKQLKISECLQESGIFEADSVDRATQTDGAAVSGDLSAEIQKLTQFRERIEEERSSLLGGNELEDKVRAVKELSAKVARLQADNSRLEEERCELEEAENDTRLRCQKLEARLQQERRISADNLAVGEKWKREVRYLETIISKYEQRNYELEERGMELGFHLELLEKCCPAIVLWLIWRTFGTRHCRSYSTKLRELEYDDMIGERQEAEGMSNASDTEYRFELQEKSCNTRELESNYLQRIKELEEELCSLRENSKDSQENSEVTELKTRISELEQKETAYMETLQQADDLWSELEGGYQNQLQGMKSSEAQLRERLETTESRAMELEHSLMDLEAALRSADEDRTAQAAKISSLSEALATTESAAEKLQNEVEQVLKPQLIQEKRLVADLQKDLTQKSETMESMQDSYETEIEIHKCQLSAVQKEYLHANFECDQLKAEVQTLENTIHEQRQCLLEQREHNERTLISLSNLLEKKDRELEGAVLASRDALVRSAHEELEEALCAQAPIQPPPRSKRFIRRASLQDGQDTRQVNRILDASLVHSKECSHCSQRVTTAVQAILSQVRVLNDLLNSAHETSHVQNTTLKKEKMGTNGVTNCVKRSNTNDTTQTETVSSDVKRTIMYWDELSSQKHSNSLKRVRVLGRMAEGENPTI